MGPLLSSATEPTVVPVVFESSFRLSFRDTSEAEGVSVLGGSDLSVEGRARSTVFLGFGSADELATDAVVVVAVVTGFSVVVAIGVVGRLVGRVA